MAASKETTQKIVSILVREIGKEKAAKILKRIDKEVTGNSSYLETVRRLLAEVSK